MMMMNVRIFTALYRLQVGDVGVVAYFSPSKYEVVHKREFTKREKSTARD
jgi:hypothetical protein